MSGQAKKRIVVLGAGSVGRRHLRNLAFLGCEVSAMDPNAERIAGVAKEVSLKNSFFSLEEVLKNAKDFDGAVVPAPPKFHINQALELLGNNIPILMEKPLAKTLEEAEKLAESMKNNPAKVLLGYTYRWWPSLIDLRSKILSGEVGKPLRAEFNMSAHLADWHPWERYQDFFMASKDLGGGALLDESHWLDLMIWFFGMPGEVFAKIGKISDLEIDTDDNVDMIISYENNLQVSIHLDLYGRPHEKSIKITGEKSSLAWNFENDLDRNIMFMGLAEDFLAVLGGEKKIKCGVPDGINVLKVIEAARRSSLGGKSEKVT